MVRVSDIRAREEKSQRYFADLDDSAAAAASDPFESIEMTSQGGGRLNTHELLMIEDNSKFVREREQEIGRIVQSIVELNTIFKDLAHMVAEQVGLAARNMGIS